MTGEAPAALPKKPPQVDLDRTRDRLMRLGLVHAAERLAEHVATAAKETKAATDQISRTLSPIGPPF